MQQTRIRRGTASAAALAALMGVSALTLVAAKPAFAQEAVAPLDNPIVTLDVRDAQMEEAIAALKQRTGIRDIVIQNPNDKRFQPVTLRLTDRPLDFVLRSICQAAGAVLTFEDGVYYVRPQGEAGPTPANPRVVINGNNAAQNNNMGQNAVIGRPRRSLIIQKIQLNYIKPSDFLRAMDSQFITTVYEQESARVQQAQAAATQNQYKQPLPNYLGQEGILPTPPGTNGGGAAAGVGAGRDGNSSDGAFANQVGGRGFGGGGQGFGGNQGGLGGPQGGQQGQGQGQQGTLRPLDVDAIISYDVDNSLVIKAQTPEAIEELRQIIRFLDVKPRQVLVRAEFVAVSINDADGFGIDWRITPLGNLDVATASVGNGASLSLAYASGNAVASLRAALIRQTTNVIQAPIISTLNNVAASISVNDSLPIFNFTQTITQGGTVVSIPNVQQSNANNFLQIIPHINGDGTITLGVAPQISSQQQVNGPGGITGARISSTNVQTTRIIRSGETMVVGGFITKQEVRSTNDVPFLSRLPIIGSLFRSRDRSVQGSETLIFLTPSIIEDTNQGNLGTGGTAPATTP